ncbi:MAG: benzoyl-CoA reductase subunit B [Kofleriaceae bacterium]|nr:benzoyl-CoA reductase subunit B [Myxococcales bacterium]MCB9561982.1 benzoyl-CoA reductase subunit B [Kofleriaceae bacterium]MCB9573150.1 benzoyl-CoA reductase subunit B [Kofleriaceae bacterium]
MTTPVRKEPSMETQKALLAGYFSRLARAKEDKRPVVYTFVPGNLAELLGAFDVAPVYPEVNALQSAMRQRSSDFIREAERAGHSEDVCSYVKCDLGMMMKGNVGPTGEVIPPPDLLLLSFTGCFTFMKWFELLRDQYDCEVAMLHIPYQGDGEITDEMRRYVVDQLQREVIPKLEKVAGHRLDLDRLRERLARSRKAEDDLAWVFRAAQHRPSPIDAYFGGVYYIGPIFTSFRGTDEACAYYAELRADVEARLAAGEGPTTPSGTLSDQKFRLVVEGPPNWTSFRDFWKIFHDEGAVAVASTYTQVGGTYERGFRHDPANPLESLADYCLSCYTNLSLPARSKVLADMVKEYDADGFVVHSVKSCNSFSAGQLHMLREVEKLTGLPGGFIESDLVDARYYGHSNIKNRIESYLQMLAARRGASRPTEVRA